MQSTTPEITFPVFLYHIHVGYIEIILAIKVSNIVANRYSVSHLSHLIDFALWLYGKVFGRIAKFAM